MNKSLRLRIPIMILTVSIGLAMSLLILVYFYFDATVKREYTEIGTCLTALVADKIDGDKVDTYLSEGFNNDEYREVYLYMKKCALLFQSIKYLYVYKDGQDCATVIFDIDLEEPGDMPGDIYEYDEAYIPYIDDLVTGNQVPTLSERTPYGYLLTVNVPVFDSNGNYACRVYADFDLHRMERQNLTAVLQIFLLFYILAVPFTLLMMHVTRKRITLPMSRLARCVAGFKFITEDDLVHNLQDLDSISIHTGDEIQMLYESARSAVTECLHFLLSSMKTEQALHKREKEIIKLHEDAYKDTLTGVGSKAAYRNMEDKLNSQIRDNTAEFAVVMCDINQLKYINDTYGHTKGDVYIKGACQLICSIFKHSMVYRIGGDEFVIIVQDKKELTVMSEYIKTLRICFRQMHNNERLQPWDRFSASIGIAKFEGQDTLADVVRIADKDMYAQKEEYKKEFGSYR